MLPASIETVPRLSRLWWPIGTAIARPKWGKRSRLSSVRGFRLGWHPIRISSLLYARLEFL